MHTLRSHPYTFCGVALFVGLTAPFLLRTQSEWDMVFVRAAEHLRAGQTIYNPADGYAYPPFMALLAVPFTFVPPSASRALWYLVNAGCLVVLCRLAWRLAGGGPLEGEAAADKKEHVLCLLGLACALRFAFDAVSHQQTDLVIGALLLGGCTLLLKGRDGAGATCFGLAAAMKCTPLLWCGYLLWRRRWLPAAWLVAVAVSANLLPDLVSPSPYGGPWLAHWLTHYLLPLRETEYYPGSWHSAIIYNQSLAGLGQRWLVLDWTGALEGVVRANPPSPRLVKGLTYGSGLVLLLAAAWVLGRRRTESADANSPPPAAMDYSVVLLLMVLLSPMSSKPHFCTLLLPAFCVARLAVQRGDRWQSVFLAAALLAGALSTRGLVGTSFASLMLWHGAVMWVAVCLLLGCYAALVRSRAGREGVSGDAAKDGSRALSKAA